MHSSSEFAIGLGASLLLVVGRTEALLTCKCLVCTSGLLASGVIEVVIDQGTVRVSRKAGGDAAAMS